MSRFSCTCNNSIRKLFTINHWSKSKLISITFWIFSKINCFIMWQFIRNCSFRKIFKISMNHIMMKAGFISCFLINISWISCLFKFLYSLFVFSKWSMRTINPGSLKWILSLNLFSSNKKCHVISFIHV